MRTERARAAHSRNRKESASGNWVVLSVSKGLALLGLGCFWILVVTQLPQIFALQHHTVLFLSARPSCGATWAKLQSLTGCLPLLSVCIPLNAFVSVQAGHRP
eukprot:COSAG01_NODE_15387_length_1344_cov_1.302008_3_plen_103_part_00